MNQKGERTQNSESAKEIIVSWPNPARTILALSILGSILTLMMATH